MNLENEMINHMSIELEFDDEELLKYMMLAHEENITFNELCERALKAKIDEQMDKLMNKVIDKNAPLLEKLGDDVEE